MIKVIIRSGILIMLLAALCMSYPDLGYAQPLCYGLDPTIVGTLGDDVIDGTSGPDVIVGLAGNDVIYGLGGDDVICGGLGDDLLIGGAGDDQLFGGKGADTLRGKAGDDLLRGGWGDDILNGGTGNDDCLDGHGNNSFLSCEVKSQCPCDFFRVPLTEDCWQRNTGTPVSFFDFPLCNSCTNEFGSCNLQMIGLDGDRDGIGARITYDQELGGIIRGCHISGLRSDKCSAPEVNYGYSFSQSAVEDCFADIEAYTAALIDTGIHVFGGGPPYSCNYEEQIPDDACIGCWDY